MGREPTMRFVIACWITMVVVVLIISFVGFSLTSVRAQKKTPQAQSLQRNLQRDANEVVDNIHYIKDTRTGLCFAYYLRTGIEGGGPALATVPCEAIPPHLLTIAK